MATGGRDEKMSLGYVRLNLSEYVEESENFPRRSLGHRYSTSLDHARIGQGLSHRRQSSSKSNGGSIPGITGGSSPPPHPEENDVVDEEAEEGIVRRYLMQDSKINSTLKIGILMVQIDGERNYVAPPLKSAPMFGGIAGIMTGTGEQIQVEAPSEDGDNNLRTNPSSNLTTKSRDASELQDMYRRALAASWACQPGELPADECIEDIFSGGDGWSDSTRPGGGKRDRGRRRRGSHRSVDSANSASGNSGSASGDEAAPGGGTLRPSDIRRMRQHGRSHSGGSDKSSLTLMGGGGSGGRHGDGASRLSRARRGSKSHKEDSHHHDGGGGGGGGMRSRSGSLTSLATTTLGSDRGREGFRRPKEVDEYEEREDLIAWKLPGTVT